MENSILKYLNGSSSNEPAHKSGTYISRFSSKNPHTERPTNLCPGLNGGVQRHLLGLCPVDQRHLIIRLSVNVLQSRLDRLRRHAGRNRSRLNSRRRVGSCRVGGGGVLADTHVSKRNESTRLAKTSLCFLVCFIVFDVKMFLFQVDFFLAGEMEFKYLSMTEYKRMKKGL